MIRKSGKLSGAALLMTALLVGCSSKATPSANEIQAAKKAAASNSAPGAENGASSKSFQTISPTNSSRDPSNLDRQGTGVPPIANANDD